jgi:DsbC/DsbD-like thiol-disulfide interchange protein
MRVSAAGVLRGIVPVGFALFASFASPLLAEKPDVRARLVLPESAPAGSRVPIAVEMSLGAGWHVNSHTPAEKFLIPTDVHMAATAGALAPIRYPPHVERRFDFAETAMLVYEGTVRFETELTLPADPGERVSITGSISFQACNDRQCFPPARIPLDASIAVAASRSLERDGESPDDDSVTSSGVAYRRATPSAAKLNTRETRDHASRDTLKAGVAFALQIVVE